MVAGCCTEELTLNVSVHRVWKAAACEDHILLPKIMPQYFSGAELIGDGEAGSTKIFHFDPGLDSHHQCFFQVTGRSVNCADFNWQFCG